MIAFFSGGHLGTVQGIRNSLESIPPNDQNFIAGMGLNLAGRSGETYSTTPSQTSLKKAEWAARAIGRIGLAQGVMVVPRVVESALAPPVGGRKQNDGDSIRILIGPHMWTGFDTDLNGFTNESEVSIVSLKESDQRFGEGAETIGSFGSPEEAYEILSSAEQTEVDTLFKRVLANVTQKYHWKMQDLQNEIRFTQVDIKKECSDIINPPSYLPPNSKLTVSGINVLQEKVTRLLQDLDSLQATVDAMPHSSEKAMQQQKIDHIKLQQQQLREIQSEMVNLCEDYLRLSFQIPNEAAKKAQLLDQLKIREQQSKKFIKGMERWPKPSQEQQVAVDAQLQVDRERLEEFGLL